MIRLKRSVPEMYKSDEVIFTAGNYLHYFFPAFFSGNVHRIYDALHVARVGVCQHFKVGLHPGVRAQIFQIDVGNAFVELLQQRQPVKAHGKALSHFGIRNSSRNTGEEVVHGIGFQDLSGNLRSSVAFIAGILRQIYLPCSDGFRICCQQRLDGGAEFLSLPLSGLDGRGYVHDHNIKPAFAAGVGHNVALVVHPYQGSVPALDPVFAVVERAVLYLFVYLPKDTLPVLSVDHI